MLETSVTRLLGIRFPVIQGGMAWLTSPRLVAAVSNAGGLGILASGPMEPDLLVKEIQEVRMLTTRPFGVNIMLMSPTASEMVKICLDKKVPIITTGAGNPGPFIKSFKDIGTKVIPVVSSVALAKRLERSGADAIIAEGTESGGHIGDITTMVLIPQIVDAVSIPVIAAGGIGDGRGILAAMSLGAEAVQMGTRFILSHECHAHPNYKKILSEAGDRDTTATGRSSGHPVRVIKNKMAKMFLEREAAGATPAELDALGRGSLRRAVVDGDMEQGSFMAGQICGLLTREAPVSDIFSQLEKEFFAALSKLSRRFVESKVAPAKVINHQQKEESA